MTTILLILGIILVAATGLTLLPYPRAKKDCLWGYRALCPFTPISSGVLAVPALVLVLLGVLL